MAVASRAESSVTPQANQRKKKGAKHKPQNKAACGRRGGGDHPDEDDFDDDKAAVMKWREKRSPRNDDPQQQQSSSSISSGTTGSSRLAVENETHKPSQLPLKAVQAWQQQQQQRQSPTNHPNTTRQSSTRKDELRSPYEVSSSSASSRSASPSHHKNTKTSQKSYQPTAFTQAAIQQQQSYVAADILPRHKQQQQQQQQQEPYRRQSPTNNNSNNNNSGYKKSSPPRQQPPPQRRQNHHDHEGLQDQMIRDVVRQQEKESDQHQQPQFMPKRNEKDDDGERIQGQFLRSNHAHPLPPRSSRRVAHHEDEDDDHLSETNDLASVSDIFSDHFDNNNHKPMSSDQFIEHSLGGDSETRERYILACRLLRSRVLQSQQQHHPLPILTPMERDLLEDLLERFQTSQAAGSQVAYEALYKILKQDEQEQQQQQQQQQQQLLPSMAQLSRSHSNNSSRYSTPSSRSLDATSVQEEEEGFQVYVKPKPRTTKPEKHQPLQTRARSWKDEKNPKAMPHLLEEERNHNHHQSSSTVAPKLVSPTSPPPLPKYRLDGWSLATRDQVPFHVMGLDRDTPPATRVLTPALMESLRGFFPYAVSEDNFWLKYSLVRDGASIRSLLRKVMASQHTILAVETEDGEVFGAFLSTAWTNNHNKKWFGTGESFLWKSKQSRYVVDDDDDDQMPNNEMEIYPYTGNDDMVQYCTSSTLAIGGGNWTGSGSGGASCPYPGEPTGIGLLVDGDLEGGETNSCATFANPPLYGRNSSKNEFSIGNLEVWTLTPCDTVALAEQLERQKYFVTTNQLSSSPIERQPLPPL